jgi:hypothetical protein
MYMKNNTKLYKKLFIEKCEHGSCIDALDGLLSALNGKPSGFGGCDIL